MLQEGGISGDFQEVQELYLSNGIATVQDGGATVLIAAVFCQLADSVRLKLDVVYPVMMMGQGSKVLWDMIFWIVSMIG